MNLSFFDEFQDRYLHTPCGKGYFLAGVTLGMLAYHQVENPSDIGSSPLFKRLQMGRLDKYTLKRMLARVPELVNAYGFTDTRIFDVLKQTMEFIAMCDSDMGVDGNYVFSMGFVGCRDYYYGKLFPKSDNHHEDK